MLTIQRITSDNKDFQKLVALLDAYLVIVDGDDNEFYHQYNGISHLKHCVIAYKDDKPAAIGAFKKWNENTVEIKRMYTSTDYRGLGLATKVLSELENWAAEIGYTEVILETGKRQVEAVQFYKKLSYSNIPNFGQYAEIENSLCFKKLLKK